MGTGNINTHFVGFLQNKGIESLYQCSYLLHHWKYSFHIARVKSWEKPPLSDFIKTSCYIVIGFSVDEGDTVDSLYITMRRLNCALFTAHPWPGRRSNQQRPWGQNEISSEVHWQRGRTSQHQAHPEVPSHVFIQCFWYPHPHSDWCHNGLEKNRLEGPQNSK